MRILITGAFGRLGQTCMAEALKQGYQINAFDIRSKTNQKTANQIGKKLPGFAENATTYWGDIRSAESIAAALTGCDAVLHLAAVLPPLTEDMPELAEAINVDGTVKIIEAIQDKGQQILLAYPSSLTVFGNQQHKPPPRSIDEPVFATDQYTQHKITCEKMIHDSGLNYIIYRVGVSVGAEVQGTDLKTLKAMLSVKAGNRLEYIHPADTALAMVNGLSRNEAYGKTLLLGGGKSCQVHQRDLINGTLGAAGISFTDEELGTNDYYTDWLDTEESQKILQYQNISFEQFRREMYHIFRLIRPLVRPFSGIIKWFLRR